MLETNEKIESFGERLVNLSEELEDKKKNQMEILELKNTVTKNLKLNGFESMM